jgi:hypothetical protein
VRCGCIIGDFQDRENLSGSFDFGPTADTAADDAEWERIYADTAQSRYREALGGNCFFGLKTKPELRENKPKKTLFPATASVECLVPVVSAYLRSHSASSAAVPIS